MALPKLQGAGRLFAFAALAEGLTWAGLLAGMYFKYSGMTDVVVWWFGRLHGGAFVFYLLVVLFTARRLRWSFWVVNLALLAAIPPLVTIPLEWWLRRRGLLADPKALPGPTGAA